jgi:hypothetical protein
MGVVNALVGFVAPNGGKPPFPSSGPPSGGHPPPFDRGPPPPSKGKSTGVGQFGPHHKPSACFMVDTSLEPASKGDAGGELGSNKKTDGGLAVGEIAGVAVASAAGALGLIAVILAACCWRKRAQKSLLAKEEILSDVEP